VKSMPVVGPVARFCSKKPAESAKWKHESAESTVGNWLLAE